MEVLPLETDVREAAEVESDSAIAAIQKRGSLRVALSREVPGFCFADSSEDEIKGFEVDLAGVLAHHIFGGSSRDALKYLDLVPVEFAERDEVVREQTVDLVLGNYADTPKRREFADFAGHYVFAPQSPLLLKSGPTIKSAEDLNGLRTAVLAGTADADTVLIAIPETEVVEFESNNACFAALESGDVQAFWSNVASNSCVIKQRPEVFAQGPMRHGGERWGFGLRKDDNALAKFVDGVVSSAFASGQLNRSLRRWLG